MNNMHAGAPKATREFLVAHGGPFYELQRRLRLLHDHALMAGRRAIVFICLAWFIPLLLGLPGSLSLDSLRGLTYIADISVWARFVIAIGLLVLAEQRLEKSLQEKLRQLIAAPIVLPSSLTEAARAVNHALVRRNSRIAEGICLLVAIVAAGIVLRHLYRVDVSSWAVISSPEGNLVTLAGWWSVVVSVPLFWFLTTRGLWRHLVWSLLLRRLARLELRLVSTHPDGKGGIAFLADYPNAYVTSVFGVSCAVAATVAQNLSHETATLTNITILMAGWLILVLALFVFPLSAFTRPLADLKKASLARLGAQATQYHRLAERKLTGGNAVSEATPNAETVEDVADPTKSYELTRKLSVTLLSHTALLPVSAAALAPFAIVASTKVPFKEVLSLVKKLLLI